MSRFLVPVLAIIVIASPAFALRVAAPNSPIQRTFQADAVVIGKVTTLEEDLVEAPAEKGSDQKNSYKIAVVKVEKALVGAEGLTHVKIGFIPTPNTGKPGLRRGPLFTPVEGQEGCFFLQKHPTAAFYIVTSMAPPLDAKAENYKAQLELVKKAIAVVAEPLKSLKADKPEDRFFAAAALISKYRTFPANGLENEQVPISAEESKLILIDLLERDWTKFEEGVPQPVQLMYQLGMNANDGWKQPAFNGKGDFNTFMKDEFKKWRDGPGEKFVMKKVVLKEKK